MKFYLKNNNFLQGLIGSLILQTTIAVFPGEAATFSNLSQLYIELNNFNQTPYEIRVDGDGTSTTMANDGLLSSNLDVDANFLVNTPILAYAQSQAAIFGTATDYLGDLRFSSLLMGKFFVLKDDFLTFDIQGSLDLFQITNDLLLGNISTLADVNILLLNHTNKNIIDVFNIFGELNNFLNQNNFLLQFSPDIKLTNYGNLIDIDAENKTIQTVFTGSFAKQFEQDTQVDLIIIAQSCNYASNIVNVCKIDPEPLNNVAIAQTVPEPSTNLAIIAFLIGLGSIRIFSKIINSMN